MRVHRSILEPIRVSATWSERWQAADKGLIAAWEAGRQFSAAQPKQAELAANGELIPLPWKGGLEPLDPTSTRRVAKGKKAPKYGCLLYLAMWQGVRGDDLDVDTDRETILECTGNKSAVIYTPDSSKYISRTE